MDVLMKATLGADWLDFFDLCIVNTRMPIFQRSEKPFYTYDKSTKNKKGIKVPTAEDLHYQSEASNIFVDGNATMLTEYLKICCAKEDVKVAFLSHNYYQDILSTFYMNEKLIDREAPERWDTIAVCNDFVRLTQRGGVYSGELICHNRLKWGDSYFYDEIAGKKVRNFFLAEMTKYARYAIPPCNGLSKIITPVELSQSSGFLKDIYKKTKQAA
jgi:hypothetical protein